MAVPGDEVGRRLGESGGKWRGARELPFGGRGRSGGGRSWALHGEGRTTAGLGGGGASPATLGGRIRTEELRWGETKLVEGSIWGGTGRNGGSTELRRRPAMVAAALVSWARERLGSALYTQGRRGRSIWGRAFWGERVLGEARTAVAARPAMAVAWRAQEQAGRVACGNGAREERFQGNKGRRSGFGRRCDAWGGQVAAPAYGSGRRHGSGKREVEETVSGNFVIRPKFQNPVL